jgi:LEA14-like dessication related protein
MKFASPLPAVFVLVCLLLAGCSSRGPIGGMTATLVDIRPTNASLLESEALATVRVTNENIAPLGFSGIHIKLYLNGSYVGNGGSNQPFGVPPLNSVTQTVTVHLENLALVKQLTAISNSQTVAYRLDSALYQTIDEEKNTIKTSSQGSLDLRSLASAAK